MKRAIHSMQRQEGADRRGSGLMLAIACSRSGTLDQPPGESVPRIKVAYGMVVALRPCRKSEK